MKIRIDPLDVLFSKYIRLLADGVCEYCGEVKRLECSHFHGRRKVVTRYDKENVAALCHSCHMYLGEHPNIHSGWFRQRLGSDRYELLNNRAQQIVKIDKEALKLDLKNRIKKLEEV